jgi:hypothetical protein
MKGVCSFISSKATLGRKNGTAGPCSRDALGAKWRVVCATNCDPKHIGLAADDVEALAGLPEGYFQGKTNVVEFA